MLLVSKLKSRVNSLLFNKKIFTFRPLGGLGAPTLDPRSASVKGASIE